MMWLKWAKWIGAINNKTKFMRTMTVDTIMFAKASYWQYLIITNNKVRVFGSHWCLSCITVTLGQPQNSSTHCCWYICTLPQKIDFNQFFNSFTNEWGREKWQNTNYCFQKLCKFARNLINVIWIVLNWFTWHFTCN